MKDPAATRVDLDDFRVCQIQRKKGSVTIELEQRRGGTTKHIVVVASGVTREDAEYYIGSNITAPHPEPSMPLDYIQFAEGGPGYLEFGGNRKGESWFVWRIVSRDIEIREGSDVDLPPDNSFKPSPPRGLVKMLVFFTCPMPWSGQI